jgi:ATP-dependent Clp protease ATP-binding subunit ClpX
LAPLLPRGPRAQWLTYSRRRLRAFSITSAPQTTHFNRSDLGGQPFSSIYDADGPTLGPLAATSNVGTPAITPKMLKLYLDEYVVGQERAKKVLSTAVYNHYQRIRELERQEREYQRKQAQKARKEASLRHPVEGTWYPVSDGFVQHDDFDVHAPASSRTSPRARPAKSAAVTSSKTSDNPTENDNVLIEHRETDEFPGQQATAPLKPSNEPPPQAAAAAAASKFHNPEPTIDIEKSNCLLLGPSGVGKTLLAKTLARVLDVPFSMSDCTPLTQAGYIGEDAEAVVQRLLAAANYDVARAETGIICLDEIDKIASARVSHGKDVSGEGVQQALLKIIEGTTVTVQAKADRTSPATGREREKSSGIPPGGYPSQGAGMSGGQQPGGGKTESYTVRTDNILFICTGAFIGLHKHVMERIAKGSIGFNAPIRASLPDGSKASHDTTIRIDASNASLFEEHLPYSFSPSTPSPYAHTPTPIPTTDPSDDPALLNTLDLVTPSDLQKFGLIPELIGRIPIHVAVAPLSLSSLIRVLTEPRNALIKQYASLFSLSNIDLRFTSAAIRAVAQRAEKLGTGARGLRGVLEGVLADSMFEAPGSGVKYVLVTKDTVDRKTPAVHLGRGQRQLFESLWRQAEESLAEEGSAEGEGDREGLVYRKKVSAAGS